MQNNHRKTLLFKVDVFPAISETFIISQILIAIKSGFDVYILVNDFKQENVKFYKKEFLEYDLLDKIVRTDLKIPTSKIAKVIKAGYLVLKNLKYLKITLKWWIEDSKNWKEKIQRIFQIDFYKRLAQFDIVHIQYGTNKFPFDFLSGFKAFNSKLIVSFHGHDAFFPINGFINDENYYDNLFTNCDIIHVNTPYLKSVLESLGAEITKIKVIPIGVDTSFFRPEKDKATINDKINIVAVGRLEIIKGHIYLLEAFKILRENKVNATLSIVGQGSQYNHLQQYIVDAQLDDCVKLLGAKSRFEIAELYKNVEIFAHTSITVESNRKETQGIVTIEAQSSGLPVVVFDSGGVRYTMKDQQTGYLCEEKNIEQLSFNLNNLICNHELRREMAINARDFVLENYDETLISTIWTDLYQN